MKNKKVLTDERKRILKEKHDAYNKKYYDKGAFTTNKFVKWEPADIKMVLSRKKSDFEIAKELGRTVASIEGCRSRYSKDKVKKTLHYKNLLIKTTPVKYIPRQVYNFDEVKKDIMEEVESEIVNKTLHIKHIGSILVEYGLNNSNNLKYVELNLLKQGVTIKKG
jgi:hypothetical protein